LDLTLFKGVKQFYIPINLACIFAGKAVKNFLAQDKRTFHLWAKLDYLVILMLKRNHQMLHALNTGSLCASGCRFHSLEQALPDGKRSVTLYKLVTWKIKISQRRDTGYFGYYSTHRTLSREHRLDKNAWFHIAAQTKLQYSLDFKSLLKSI
jgi:hypothetical protein